jgi:hypothetical protein
MNEYRVGTTILKENETWLIVRIVDSKAFFEDTRSKECYIMDELYLELRNHAGDISFVALREHKETVQKPQELADSGLRGPDTLEWRKAGRINDL